MRLIEEKILMKLNMVSVFFILFSTIMIQIADYQINNYNDYFTKESLRLFQTHQVKNDYKQNADFYTLCKVVGGELVDVNEEEVFDSKYLDPIVRQLVIELESHKISYSEYVDKFIIHCNQESKKMLERYNAIINDLKNKKPPQWIWMRNFIFVPLQFIGIGILLWGYIHLGRLISERTMKIKA